MSSAVSCESNPYEYEGIVLTPRVFGNVLEALAPGQMLRRSEAVNLVVQHHQKNGGLAPVGRPSLVAKKALSLLSDSGRAKPAGAYGMWRIQGEPDGTFVLPSERTAQAQCSEFLYVYYLPAYAALAERQGEDKWPHKIGMTTVSVDQRVADQIGTALPERPAIVHTEEAVDAALLERAVHAVLELRGRRIDTAPGSEWFRTNGDEVRDIIAFCLQD